MLLEILVLLTSIPAGLVLAALTKDELKDGKKYFKALIIISLILSIVFFIIGPDYIALTLLYIAIATFISYKKA